MRTRAKSFLFASETPVTNVPNTAAHQMREERKSVSPLVSDKWIWEHLGEKEVPLCSNFKYLQHSAMSTAKLDLIFNHEITEQ